MDPAGGPQHIMVGLTTSPSSQRYTRHLSLCWISGVYRTVTKPNGRDEHVYEADGVRKASSVIYETLEGVRSC